MVAWCGITRNLHVKYKHVLLYLFQFVQLNFIVFHESVFQRWKLLENWFCIFFIIAGLFCTINVLKMPVYFVKYVLVIQFRVQ